MVASSPRKQQGGFPNTSLAIDLTAGYRKAGLRVTMWLRHELGVRKTGRGAWGRWRAQNGGKL